MTEWQIVVFMLMSSGQITVSHVNSNTPIYSFEECTEAAKATMPIIERSLVSSGRIRGIQWRCLVAPGENM